MPTFRKLLFLVPALILQGCPWYGYKYNTGTLPTEPVNFEEINSPYDDYNASAPTAGRGFPLCFSSSRHSQGENYDIVYKFITVEFSKNSGELKVYEGSEPWEEQMKRCENLKEAVAVVNTPYHERGPCILEDQSWQYGGNYDSHTPFMLLYDNDSAGHRDILFTHNVDQDEYLAPQPALSLNSPFNDAYPCPDVLLSAIYFCSDRDGDYDIYRLLNTENRNMFELLEEPGLPLEKDSVLSSAGNDLCPYIAYHAGVDHTIDFKDGLLVFASDREGGFGGYDLYFSQAVDGGWGEPVNFGPGINTSHDEFRPIVLPLDEFTHDFMLFSSNRPGGLGGFDLYYVGINDIK